jgi:hypothetical protein
MALIQTENDGSDINALSRFHRFLCNGVEDLWPVSYVEVYNDREHDRAFCMDRGRLSFDECLAEAERDKLSLLGLQDCQGNASRCRCFVGFNLDEVSKYGPAESSHVQQHEGGLYTGRSSNLVTAVYAVKKQ